MEHEWPMLVGAWGVVGGVERREWPEESGGFSHTEKQDSECELCSGHWPGSTLGQCL